MGILKQAKADMMAEHAARAASEGRSVFVAQIRPAWHNSPNLSHPLADVAEMIESVEAKGWRVDQFTAVPYDKNTTVTILFRRA